MPKKIIKIDREKCSGCGACVSACEQGAIGLKDGKAEVLHHDYCDGFLRCLPVCPEEAILFQEERI